MRESMPDYLSVPPGKLGEGVPVKVHTCGDMMAIADGSTQRQKLVQLYRRFQPTLVPAHWKEDYRSNHRAAGALAEAASWYCAESGHKTRAAAMARQPALWWMDRVNMTGFEPGFFVDVTDQLDLTRRMLACHRSQLRRARDGDFASLEQQMNLRRIDCDRKEYE